MGIPDPISNCFYTRTRTVKARTQTHHPLRICLRKLTRLRKRKTFIAHSYALPLASMCGAKALLRRVLIRDQDTRENDSVVVWHRDHNIVLKLGVVDGC